jgi:hypothetical protein
MMDDGMEILKATPEDRQESWATRVIEACGGRCANCGSDHRLKVRMIVPEESGGKKTVSNGTLLCRTCELAREISLKVPQPASGERTRPINFFVSQDLHAKLQNGLATKYGFRSVSALVRFLMSKYVTDPSDFDDLEMFQDSGSEVKVNVWVGRDIYASFKAITDRDGTTVTDTLKGLIRMYETEAQRIVGRMKG